jgi:hypothetical protein
MNEEFLNRIVGLYSVMTEATFQTSSRLIIYKDNLLYHSPSIRLSREAVEDLKAYSFDIESHIMSSIIKEFKEEQYTLMSKEDIDLASSQIEYLKISIQRDKKINEILNQ